MRAGSTLTLACAIICCSFAGAEARDAQDLRLQAAAGVLIASDSDGSPVWEMRVGDGQFLSWQMRGDGSVWLSNGMIVGPDGQLLAQPGEAGSKHSSPASGRQAGDGGFWSPLAEITPPPGDASDSHESPLFDSLGNAWVFVTHLDAGDYSLQLRRSKGHSGGWDALATISDTTNYVSGPEGAIDPADNITVVFRDINAGYKLYAMRYVPGSGWSGPDQVYSTGDFFQAIRIAADADGNVPVVFDPGFSPNKAMWSTIYDADSGTWSAPVQISPVGYDALLPTVVQNRAGDTIFAIYLVQGGGPTGLYAHRFDSVTKTWGPAELLGGSSSAGFTISLADSRFPATVDNQGNATVLWETAQPGPFGIYANRTAGGVWQDAHELLAPSPYNVGVENFGDIDSNDSRDALGVVTRSESGQVSFYAFLYDAIDGWAPLENPYTSTVSWTTRVRVCYWSDAEAIATLYGWQDSAEQLTSLAFKDSAWLPDLIDIPEGHVSFFQESESNQGEALLVYEGEEGGNNQGIVATWLREPLFADGFESGGTSAWSQVVP